MNSRGKKRVLVFAHDAGGAEVIAAYLLKQRAPFVAYVAGPAARIFRRMKISFLPAPRERGAIARIVKKNTDAPYLLTATGWMTSIERDALREAKRAEMKTCVYLESWTNYRERFGHPGAGWQSRLPDELWLGDEHAMRLAKKLFPKTQKLRFVPNEYFKNIITRYKTLARGKKPSAVLFMSDATKGTEHTLEDLLSHLDKEQKRHPLIIRFHPADERTRYDALIRKYRSMHIKKSGETDIVKDLIRARVVIGVETVAMVAALLVGKKTISLAHLSREPFLPFTGILRVDHARDAVNLL